MGALSFGFPTLTTHNNNNNNHHFTSKLLGCTTYSFNSINSSSLRCTQTPRLLSYRRGARIIRMQAVNEDFELKQVKDMAAARKRWEALIREEKVKVLTPKEAGYATQLSNTTLLDVRPSTEYAKAWVKGSTWIPVFEVDNGLDLGTLSRKISGFVMGGWWSGVPSLSYNNQFMVKVTQQFPKDSDLIVACQKGLRSLAACELLYNAGYRNLYWVQGGLEAAEEEDLNREGPQPFKFAGIGGLSEFLGWTDQQRAQAAKEGWGYRLVFTIRVFVLIVVADGLFLGAQEIPHYLQEVKDVLALLKNEATQL